MLSEHISPTSQSESASIVQLHALFSNAWFVPTPSFIKDLWCPVHHLLT